MATSFSYATWPVGKTLHIELPKDQRVTLQNNVVTMILRLDGLDHGTWMVTGSCDVQDTDNEVVSGHPYVYTYSGLSTSPNHLPQNGFITPDARPYRTIAGDDFTVNPFWWFAINPVPRPFTFAGEPPVFLLVLSYGPIAPTLSQAWGSITAVKIAP